MKIINRIIAGSVILFTLSFLYWLFGGDTNNPVILFTTCIIIPIVISGLVGYAIGRRGRPRIAWDADGDKKDA